MAYNSTAQCEGAMYSSSDPEWADLEGNYCWTRSSDEFSPYTYSTESSYNSVATAMSAFDRAKRGEILGRRAKLTKSSRPDDKTEPNRSHSSSGTEDTKTRMKRSTETKRPKAKAVIQKPEIKDIWVEICHLHPGNMVNVNHTLPPPCNLCKASDGHGQKGRAFRVPKLYQVLGNDVQMTYSETGVTGIKYEGSNPDDDMDCEVYGGISKLTLVNKIKAVFHGK